MAFLRRTPEIEKLKAKGDVKGLMKALEHKEQSISANAADALVSMGPSILPAVEQALMSGNHTSLIDILSRLGQPALPALARALQYDDIRKQVVQKLEAAGWQPDQTAAGAYYWIEKQDWDRCVEIGAPAVEPLIGMLKDAQVSVKASHALLSIGEPALKALVGTLAKNDGTSFLASMIVAEMGTPAAVELLAGKCNKMPRDAMIALINIGEDAIGPIEQATKEGRLDPSVAQLYKNYIDTRYESKLSWVDPIVLKASGQQISNVLDVHTLVTIGWHIEQGMSLLVLEPKPETLQKLLKLPPKTGLGMLKSATEPFDVVTPDGQQTTYDPKDYTLDDIVWAETVVQLGMAAEDKAKACHYREALPLLEKALCLAPGNDLLLQTYAVCYAQLKQFGPAITILEKACSLYPNNQRMASNLEAIRRDAAMAN